MEGPQDAPLMRSVDDASLLLESCFSAGTRSALLYAENLPERFFDLSSGEAGAILQKLKNYGVRLAVVCPPGRVAFSSRFPEMAAEERATGWFGIFESADAARQWLQANSA